MSQENPYLKVYINMLNPLEKSLQKDHLFALAVNLGHVHNLFGVMISDVIKMMGNLMQRDEQIIQLPQHLVSQKSRVMKQDKSNRSNKNFARTNLVNNPSHLKSNPYIPEKMQIENLQQFQLFNNDKRQSEQVIAKSFDLNEFQFEKQKVQEKVLSFQPIKKRIFSQLFFQTDQKVQHQHQTKKQHHQEEQCQSSNTESVEEVRYNKTMNKHSQNNSFQQLARYASHNAEGKQQKQYHVKVNVKDKVNDKVKSLTSKGAKEQKKLKVKSPFFDLFDSSQTMSNLEESEGIGRFSPVSEERKFEQKQYPQTQNLQMDQDFLFQTQREPKFSSQFKQEKPSNKFSNTSARPIIPLKNPSSNLLEHPFSAFSPGQHSNLPGVQQIDEIETTQKKPFSRTLTKRKDEKTKRQENQQFDEYIPRREEIGRKKIEREGVKGSQCPDCSAFYEAVGENSKNFKNVCECTSRHKSSTAFMKQYTVKDYSQAFELD